MSTDIHRAALARQLVVNGWSEPAIAAALHVSVERVRQLLAGGEDLAFRTSPEQSAPITCAPQACGSSKTTDDETGIRKLLSLPYRGSRQASDRAYWTELLRRTGGNVTAAAELAGYSRESAHRIIRRLNIERPRPGPGAWKRLRDGRKALDM